jgi:hypothetical protein
MDTRFSSLRAMAFGVFRRRSKAQDSDPLGFAYARG